MVDATTHIRIHGAREHNLKNVSLDIPKRTLAVITGVSGSGKSSLAFDTIYAEGQRRYVESLSAYARQFLQLSNKPDVDRIEGLAPAIAIEQKTTSKNPRSTVGTITEIYDYLRLLFANAGNAYCPHHPTTPIEGVTIQQMVDQLVNDWPENQRLMVLAPVVQGRKGEYKKEIQHWQQQGYTRLRIDGEIYAIEDAPALDKKLKHTLEVVVDRLALKEDNLGRLAESLENALKLADGLVQVEALAKAEEDIPAPILFSEKHACPTCGHGYTPEPRLFSFNSPYGACQQCDGLGEEIAFDKNLIVPDDRLTLSQGALHPWKDTKTGNYYLKALSKHYKFSLETPWHKLSEDVQTILLYGSGQEEIEFTFEGGKGTFKTHKTYDGIVNILQRRWEESKSPYDREDLNRYRSGHVCTHCNGARLNPNALAVRINGKNIRQFCELSIEDALTEIQTIGATLTGARGKIAAPIVREVEARLGFLAHVGLGYLSLNRSSGTLSGGESQRIRLASQIGSGLTGVLYVLDEPSIGLHQRDNNRLLETLHKLRDLDNTVIVVEHDEDAIRQADFLVDIGPGAGEHGGKIIAHGTAEDIINTPHSTTGQYLSGKKSIGVPKKRRPTNKKKMLSIHGASANNLQNVTAHFPVGTLTCVTGVSGSGKSTLVMDTLYAALATRLNGSKDPVGKHDKVTGLEHIDKIVNIDQAPIGRTPRSNPATYTGVMGPVREWFASLPESKAHGYKPGRFSFNVKGGRCEACEGDGVIRVEMHFLPDVYVPCEVCNSKRFNRETLEIAYKGKNIADVLNMPVEDALEYFANVPTIARRLQTLMDVGLGYIRLGQPATQLSGGEAQRIKLSKELSKRATGRTLYILDEPTTGLHFSDIDQLLKVLHRLVDGGNTMVIIEHNLDVIKTADWLVDVGPEGGSGGGQIIAEGTPEDIAKCAQSHTGEFLKPLLKKQKSAA
ncbi:MAG: excinuclease ABC subunit UvrA [Alphaproteobacteria bacterium]|nr:excinuclease ABC subunit UvrA [Alphaproteobacteria bacterium]MDD9919201.1 excinuclease ABC subunit UvrA [Alphaproteobacteria bacterium]